MAGSISSSHVVSHTTEEEYVKASFTLSGSVASVAYSFNASFSKAPLLAGVGCDTDDRLDFWITSNTSTGAKLNVKGDTAATSNINATFQFKPDLS